MPVRFEDSLELFFKCPSCGEVLKRDETDIRKHEKMRKSFSKKIDHIKGDLRV